MKSLFAGIGLFAVLLLAAPGPALAETCKDARCTAAEVGPFMQNITKACGNTGDCDLTDIMSVIKNVGNFTLGIVGSLVLAMYVWGGFEFLTAGGNREHITAGIKKFKTATIGLVIVFFAYAFVFSIVKLVETGST